MYSRITSIFFITLFILGLTSSALPITHSSVTAQNDSEEPLPADAFILLNASSIAEMDQAISFIQSQGGTVPLSFDSQALFVRFPLGLNPTSWIGQAGIRSIHTEAVAPNEVAALNNDQASLAAKVWNHWQTSTPYAISAEINTINTVSAKNLQASLQNVQPQIPLIIDELSHHKQHGVHEAEGTEIEDVAEAVVQLDKPSLSIQEESTYKPQIYQTSEFLLGSYQIDLFLPESSGNGENWSEARRDEAIIGVATGIIWWTSAAEIRGDKVPNLSFNMTVHDPFVTPNEVATQYEPINLDPQSEGGAGLWVNEIMSNMGYSDNQWGGLLPHLANTWTYVDTRRQEQNRDWGFAIFIVDSLNDDGDLGFFPDGQRFAFAWRYGPFLTMTYDTGNYAKQIGAINGLKINTIHELAHIFGAPEEYNVGCSVTDQGGYFHVYNTNCEADGTPPFELSPMRIPNIQIQAMPAREVSTPLRAMAGWRDSDSDGLMDPLDTTPVLAIQEVTALGNDQYQFKGMAMDIPFAVPDQRVKDTVRNAVTINKIASVQYRALPQAGDEGWQDCSAEDSAFDSSEEAFTCLISGANGTDIAFRVRNSVDNISPQLSTQLAALQSREDAPPQLAIQVSGGSSHIQDTTISLGISALSSNKIHANRVRYNGTWSEWTAYDGGVGVVLNGQDGTHTVDVQIQDETGQMSDIYSHEVFLDLRSPEGSISLNGAPNSPGTTTIDLQLNASDSNSIVAMNLYVNGIWYGWEAYTDVKSVSTLLSEGVNEFKVRYKDQAGNISALYRTTHEIEVATPVPTNTPAPTATSLPTHTPLPTATPLPTNTPVPTNTPFVEDTAVPAPTVTAIPESPSVSTDSQIYLPLLTR